MISVARLPYVVAHDEGGAWCASARLRPGVSAVGDGPAREAATADLLAALDLLLDEAGWPGRECPQSWEAK